MKSFKDHVKEQKEGPNTTAAKERIKRERKADGQKFDRIMDTAKVRDAKLSAQQSKPKMQSESVREYTLNPDLDRLINRVANKKAYEKAVRFYLDYRRQNPGKARENALKAAQITGADYRNLEKIIHDMIRDGKLPQHLAWRKDLIQKKTIKQKLQSIFKK